MTLTPADRAWIARRIEAVRRVRFADKKDAYTKGKINSMTWARLEAGESVKQQTLERVAKFLWPQTGGDYTAIPLNPTGDAAVDKLVREKDRRAEQLSRDTVLLAAVLSDPADTDVHLVAAHDEEGSISGEQEQPETP